MEQKDNYQIKLSDVIDDKETSEIIDNTIKIITNNAIINTCEYSNTGKKLENSGLELSSIVEEG